MLRLEFGLSADEAAILLAGGDSPCSPEEIALAIKGVFQNAVIPATTKISDEATRNALIAYDPTTGQMAFSSKTALVGGLKRGDVIVSEPSAAAPNGFLRKVTGVRSGGLIFDTSQASFNDAIKQGTLDAAATLRPDDLLATEPALEGVTFRTLSRKSESGRGAELVGDDYDFETSFDITINSSAAGDGVNGDGHVRIQGSIRFNAGYDVGFGVDPCLKVPPVCVDRMEGRLGIDHYSSIRVSGEFNGTMQKEYKLSTHYFKPIVFFIGPVPVVLVPVLNAVVGANGEAHLKFSFAADLSAQLLLGAKWTEENGWEDLSRKNGVRAGIIEQNLDANMKLRAYGKADGKLLFYGVAGPGFDSRIGGGVDVQVPRRPWWRVFGYIGAHINFQADLGGLLKLSEFSKTVLDEEFTLVDAPNQAPRFSNVNTGVIQADIGTPFTLGPRSGFGGHFDVQDLEGDNFTLTAVSNVDGPIDLVHSFQTGGLRTITITAKDSEGASSSITLTVNVNNSLPIINVTTPGSSVPATVQYNLTASAYDFDTGQYVACNKIEWSVVAPNTRTNATGCATTVIFANQGTHSVTVKATDINGGVSTEILTVNVTPPPQNPAPLVDFFSIRAQSALCPDLFISCEVPADNTIYNGQSGDYLPPLKLLVTAHDSGGDPLTVQWNCNGTLEPTQVTDNGGGSFTFETRCSPSFAREFIVGAAVTDGTTSVPAGAKRFFMNELIK
jgi:hypothetical protein